MRPHRDSRNLSAAVLAGRVCGCLSVVFATTILDVAGRAKPDDRPTTPIQGHDLHPLVTPRLGFVK